MDLHTGLAVTGNNVDAIIARQAFLDAKKAYFTPVVATILGDPSYLRPLDQAR